MQKPTLNLDALEVVSFETELPDDSHDELAISGTVCISRPTVYGTCCTP